MNLQINRIREENMLETFRTEKDRHGVISLTITGVLDKDTSEALGPIVDAIVAEKPTRVVLRLEDLQEIDSRGVGVIISLFKRVRANGGKVEITGLRDQPRMAFRLLRLDWVFPV